MKKLLITLALVAGLAACTKEKPEGPTGSGFAPEPFFSRVRYYGDGRQPKTDTIWTIKVMGDSMYSVFSRLNGYVYADHSPTYIELGQLWEKRR